MSFVVTLASASELFVSPGKAAPSLRHRNIHGPEPDAVVKKLAVWPAQFVMLVSGVAAVSWRTVSVAELVMLPHRPLTSTE